MESKFKWLPWQVEERSSTEFTCGEISRDWSDCRLKHGLWESEYTPNELQKRKEKREKSKSLIVLALHKLHYMFPESSELDIIQTQGKWPVARNPDSS